MNLAIGPNRILGFAFGLGALDLGLIVLQVQISGGEGLIHGLKLAGI